MSKTEERSDEGIYYGIAYQPSEIPTLRVALRVRLHSVPLRMTRTGLLRGAFWEGVWYRPLNTALFVKCLKCGATLSVTLR